ncbi:DUF4389 domain-containing protein [Marinimicrobium sp. ABcell2]|uniref:DUF4389 domain-containing protein n=1 Tax=Marinimicrobium sp. ABcell2 TaxID=3069751 RepID=UPI0027B0D548|nr:DUF4389 domain-containing protein [Marinimicrobium sp. ABcell2]MDQ2075515.1 DUF4389 domain-containing protein [Marinimicrobium sp. ABcell2]
MNSEELKSNLTSGTHWLRLLFMVLFAFILYVAVIVMAAVVVLQFLFSLITGRDNRNLREFGQSLAQYIYQTLRFLTYNREDKPFPFDDWPATEESTAPPPASARKPRPRASRAKGAVTKRGTSAKAAAKTKAPKPPTAEAPPEEPTNKPPTDKPNT